MSGHSAIPAIERSSTRLSDCPPSSLAPSITDTVRDHNEHSDASAAQTLATHSPSSSRTASVVEINPLGDKPSNIVPSFFHLLVAHIGAAMVLFLATTDATIVSTSLPTIIADLHAPQSQYSWVGVAYSVPQTALQPLYGQFSDILGRKAGHLGFSSHLKLSKNIADGAIYQHIHLYDWLFVVRTCTSPLLGGVFSDADGILSWRWAFFINLPIALAAWLLLHFSLRNVPHCTATGMTWSKLRRRFDVLGLAFFMCGTIGVVLGFNFSSQYGWVSPATLVPLSAGCVVLIIGSVYEKHTKRDALFPSRMFDNVTVATILIISFLHNFAFNAGTFFLALYYQAVNGSSGLEAGMRMLPYSLGASLASMPAAWSIAYWQRRTKSTIGLKFVIVTGLAVAATGFGLLIALNVHTPVALQEIAPLVAGIGIGMLFHSPYQVLTRALRPEDIASATSAFFLVRFTGATCGLAVGAAVFNGRLSHSDYAKLLGSATSIDLRALAKLQPLLLREEVLGVVSSAIQSIWIVCTPCLALALLISPLIKVATTESMDQKHDLDTDTEDNSEKVMPA
ncbi:MFS general substrate transporter [Sanghuangporus baumii]|uniref:MFS general substrate transporter n=1 Tax=Sanghuangporus baumii TaxID=108892 RepID=A0A9Q5N9A6_SANBA|nr:MFS general substrate transporter [Sanghuangporus baumii]